MELIAHVTNLQIHLLDEMISDNSFLRNYGLIRVPHEIIKFLKLSQAGANLGLRMVRMPIKKALSTA